MKKGAKSEVAPNSTGKSMFEVFLNHCHRGEGKFDKLFGSLLCSSVCFSSHGSKKMILMRELVAMLLNGGVKTVLTFMGMRFFAKNGMPQLPRGTSS